MKRTHFGQHSDCFGCKVQSVQLSNKATPTRTRRSSPTPDSKDNSNAWERGIVEDRPGMPYLDQHLEPIGVKEWVNNRKRFEEARDKLNHERSTASHKE